ncbi:MAG: thermonuclease family protein [Chloroflexales bacterium]|nr:thermonuclease family protein [Chloroflexales bacterium]
MHIFWHGRGVLWFKGVRISVSRITGVCRRLFVLLGLCALILPGCGGGAGGNASTAALSAIPEGLPRARVDAVVDGDTVDVRLDNQIVRLRLIGINTPETVDPRRPVECFGREASEQAKELLTGQTVFLEADETQGDRDDFGRLLRYIWLPDGRLFNQIMIADGFAYEFTFRIPYHYQEAFQRAQDEARESQRGLWSPTTCGGERQASASSAEAPASPEGDVCQSEPNAGRASDDPVRIVGVDKRDELVQLKNVSDAPVELTGWTLCSLAGSQVHEGIGGVLRPGETRDFPFAGSDSIWSNSNRDDGALYDPEGRLVSYWVDQE